MVAVMEEKRDQFDEFEAGDIKRVGRNNYKATTRCIRKRNRKYDDGSGPENILELRERF